MSNGIGIDPRRTPRRHGSHRPIHHLLSQSCWRRHLISRALLNPFTASTPLALSISIPPLSTSTSLPLATPPTPRSGVSNLFPYSTGTPLDSSILSLETWLAFSLLWQVRWWYLLDDLATYCVAIKSQEDGWPLFGIPPFNAAKGRFLNTDFSDDAEMIKSEISIA